MIPGRITKNYVTESQIKKVILGIILFTMVLLITASGCAGAREAPFPVPIPIPAPEITPTPTPTTTPSAVKGLKTDWNEEMVYENLIVYPAYFTKDGDGNILIVSRGNNKILKLSGEGQLSTYLDTNSLSTVFSIGYQPGLGRLLIANDQSTLYGSLNGQLTTLKPFGIVASTIVVKTADDSFYTGSQSRDSQINHYDANGNLLSTIVDGVDGCFELALDETHNKLYYSETFAGRITEVALSDNSKRIIATGVGIPGTVEPIAVALDGENDLYFFTANNGLNKFEAGSFTKVMDSVAGVGPMTWSPIHSGFLVGNGVGANIISYQPSTATSNHLTQYVNALGIVEMDDGTVLVGDGDFFGGSIQKVDSSGFTPFTPDLGTNCRHLERDTSGNIYAGMTDGTIWRIAADGSATPWASEYSNYPVVSLHYDSKNNTIISFTGNPQTSTATIWRIPLNTPNSPTKVLELSNVRITGSLPAGAVDDSGNIYVLERKANVIYQIPSGATTTTIFASSVLSSEAITVPRIEYLSKEQALLVTTIENYELWPLNNPVKSTFAMNNGGVDNFGINANKNGDLIAIHSGRVFRFVYSPGS